MTKDHDFKRLVRERAARTGETYMQAHDQLRPRAGGLAAPDEGEPALPPRRRLVLVAASHVSVKRTTGVPRPDNELGRLGIDLSRSRPPVELYVGEDDVFIDIDHRIDVDLTDDFDLVIDAQGRITVEGISGSVDAATTNGHVSLEGSILDAAVDTGDGHITVLGAQGTCTATTDNGHITVRGHVTCATLDTGAGHIAIDTVEYGDIHTPNGRVEVAIAGIGATLAVQADTAVGDPTFVGRKGDWSALLGHDHSRLLALGASSRVTVHDRTS